MKKLRLFFAIVSMFLFPALVSAQENKGLADKTRASINEWKGYAEVLKTYQGLSQYCRDNKFRTNVIATLNDIHHYDSLILQNSVDKNTKEDIIEFEKKYSVSNFNAHLKKECKERREVEKAKRNNSDDGFATASYDAQKLVVETEVQRYINHVNKVTAHIDRDLKKSDL